MADVAPATSNQAVIVLPDNTPIETQIQRRLTDSLERPVSLVIEHRKSQSQWEFLVGHPENIDGSRIDISTTVFSTDYAEGYFDDVFMALSRSNNETGSIELIQFDYGATDAPFIAWAEQYGIPVCLFSRTALCD